MLMIDRYQNDRYDYDDGRYERYDDDRYERYDYDDGRYDRYDGDRYDYDDGRYENGRMTTWWEVESVKPPLQSYTMGD